MPQPPILDLLTAVPPRHRHALQWFHEHAGEELPWPRPLPDGTLLATRAKGIYKPQWSLFALSVRQTLDGPYPDRPVRENADGTWSYEYFQEGLEVDERDQAFTNRGLLNCWMQVVPVGVLLQTRASPTVRYRVLGLALVTGYEEGYFCLEGISQARVSDASHLRTTVGELSTSQSRADLIAGAFDLARITDERRTTHANITRRQGQAGFRRTLLNAYGRQCAVTAYDAEDALEAAHIVPYRGPMTNHPSNGLLLRADLHSLFDFGLICVDPDRWQVVLSSDIRKSAYEKFHGTDLRLPADPMLRPSAEAIRQHRDLAGV